MINMHIIIAGVIIAGVTMWHHSALGDTTTTNTRIAVGAFIFVGLAALLDLVPGVGDIAGALALLAAFYVVANDLPSLLALLNINPQEGGPPPTRGRS